MMIRVKSIFTHTHTHTSNHPSLTYVQCRALLLKYRALLGRCKTHSATGHLPNVEHEIALLGTCKLTAPPHTFTMLNMKSPFACRVIGLFHKNIGLFCSSVLLFWGHVALTAPFETSSSLNMKSPSPSSSSSGCSDWHSENT